MGIIGRLLARGYFLPRLRQVRFSEGYDGRKAHLELAFLNYVSIRPDTQFLKFTCSDFKHFHHFTKRFSL